MPDLQRRHTDPPAGALGAAGDRGSGPRPGHLSGIRTRAQADTDLARETIGRRAGGGYGASGPRAPTRAIRCCPAHAGLQRYRDLRAHNGYLKRWYFDIGAQVKAGQLLAEIDTPEVDDQLRQALADLATARPIWDRRSQRSATRTCCRHSVSNQEPDNAVGMLNTDKAIVQSSQATVAAATAPVLREDLRSLRRRDRAQCRRRGAGQCRVQRHGPRALSHGGDRYGCAFRRRPKPMRRRCIRRQRH